jgi:hypothetical protein
VPGVFGLREGDWELKKAIKDPLVWLILMIAIAGLSTGYAIGASLSSDNPPDVKVEIIIPTILPPDIEAVAPTIDKIY